MEREIKKIPEPEKPALSVEQLINSFPENHWINKDDKTLKKSKYHFEVDRMLTCHCDQHTAQARQLINKSFQEYTGGPLKTEFIDYIQKVYENNITKERRADDEIPRDRNEITIISREDLEAQRKTFRVKPKDEKKLA